MNSMEKTRAFLRSVGLPGGDAYDLPTSEKRFADGGQYRFEVPGIQGPKVMQALLEAMDGYGLYLHRVTQTQGIMRLTDQEIGRMVELAHKWETDLILAIGPRATTDTSASVNTEEGVRMGYRLRGQEQIVRAVEDVKRAARLGCRGFLVYDEGCLWILNEMRKAGEIPADCHFKISAHAGHGNPCAAKLLESIGADFIVIATNTMHKLVPEMEKHLHIPILHIADAAAKRIKEDGLRRVGFLGTKFTMTQDFIKERLVKAGLEVLVPEEQDIKIIDDIIFNELCLGNVNDASRNKYQQIIEKMKDAGAEGVILGCTEIGLLVQEEDTDLPVFDTTLIHAEKAALYSISE